MPVRRGGTYPERLSPEDRHRAAVRWTKQRRRNKRKRYPFGHDRMVRYRRPLKKPGDSGIYQRERVTARRI